MRQVFIRGALALFAVLSMASAAEAAKTSFRTKGASASATLNFEQLVTCPAGSPEPEAVIQTSVGISMFETSERTSGTTTGSVRTNAGVIRFNGCTFEFTFGFVDVPEGELNVQALNSGTMSGHFVLDDLTTLDLNLTLTGGDVLQKGTRFERSILGNVLTITRATGSFRDATVSGTVAINGQTFSAADSVSSTGELARNTGSETIIVQP